jgi:capsular polysaccharide biosynthesis protein
MKTSLFTRVAAAVRHQWLVVVCVLAAGSVAAFFVLVSSHPKYTATATVLMVPQATGADPSLSATSATPVLSTDLPSLATNPTVLSRFRDDMGELADIDELRAHISAKVNVPSSIMPVQYTAKERDAAVRGANTLSDEVVRFYREIATARFDSLITDFNSQLATRRTELARLDGQLATAAKTYPYIDVAAPGESASGSDSVYGRLIAIQAERDTLGASVSADAAAAQATALLIRNATPLAERDVVNADSTYLSVREQYAKDFGSLQKLGAFGSERYPGIVELRATVAREAAMVAAARKQALSVGPASNATYVAALDAKVTADALLASDRAKLQAHDAELAQLHGQIGHGSIATDVARIRRDHGSAEAAYAIIAARLAKTIADRSEAASTGSVIVFARAQSASPAGAPGGAVIAVAIMFLTVWLAFTLAVMIDGNQEWFNDAETVELIYGSKPIGSIA